MTDIAPTTPLQVTIHPLPQNVSGAQADSSSFWSDDVPSFKDLLDTINPLQHIPIVSNIYQSLTGDIPSTGAKIAGGALFGGAIGLIGSVFDSILKSETGADFGGNLLAAIKGDPIPAMQHPVDTSVAFMTANQRTGYNAYVQASQLS